MGFGGLPQSDRRCFWPAFGQFLSGPPSLPQTVVGTKAFTQAVSHLMKMLVFGSALWVYLQGQGFLGFAEVGLALGAGSLGTVLGTQILGKIRPGQFQNISRIVLILLAGFCVGRAVSTWLGLFV